MKLFLYALLLSSSVFADPYPEEWFRPIPRDQASSWEVLPQDAGPGEVILSKRTELGILSNFAATAFIYRGVRYASIEGFWQMMKYPEGPSDPRHGKLPYSRQEVSQMTAFDAKKAGDLGSKVMKDLGIDWVTFEGQRMVYCSTTPAEHYRLVLDAMKEKLKQNLEVQRLLMATGDLVLRPDHHASSCKAPEWNYHEIWMLFRDDA